MGRVRRRHVDVTVLPGGFRISLCGYLPNKRCVTCRFILPAAEFIARVKIQRGRWVATFGQSCLACSKPGTMPADLRGLKLRSTYTSSDGKLMGWRERDARGEYGPELPLERMQLRVWNGVCVPQPNLNRDSLGRRHREVYPLRDPRRTFSRAEKRAAWLRQGQVCPRCGLGIPEDDIVGDHIRPHADGWPTIEPNCQALHTKCNASKSDKDDMPHRFGMQEGLKT